MSALDLGKLIASEKPVRLKMPSNEGFQLTAIGASGSGKTNTLYQLIEGLPAKRPIFIADPEQDFVPLRRHRHFIIVGKGRDLPADPAIAELLARRWLESGFNIIFDAFEEPKQRRELFLKGFLQALHDAPRKLWRPATLILDELDTWAPEKGEGESLCTEACAAAAKRFRKRGFDLIMATTRPAAVNKTVISMSRNLLIGLANIDTDVKRALSFLGFTEKEDRASYRDLQRGEFFGRGPELGLRRPEKILIRQSKLYQPQLLGKAGARSAPAPKGQVKKLLLELKDLPAEVREEAQDRDAMKKRIRELELQIRTLEQNARAAVVDPAKLESAVNRAVAASDAEWRKKMQAIARQKEQILRQIDGLRAAIEKLPDASAAVSVDPRPRVAAPVQAKPVWRSVKPTAKAQSIDLDSGELGRSERAILKFLAARSPKAFSRTQISAWTGYSVKSSSFDGALAKLSKAHLVERDSAGKFMICDDGLLALGDDVEEAPRSLRDWLPKLKPSPRKLLEVFLEGGHATYTRGDLSEVTGYSQNSSSFDGAISELISLGFVTRDHGGALRLNSELGDAS